MRLYNALKSDATRVVIVDDEFELGWQLALPTFRDEFGADRSESKRVQNTF